MVSCLYSLKCNQHTLTIELTQRLQIVCFLDYNDFFAFNFPTADLIAEDAPRQPINVGEAVRLISMHLEVESIEPPGPDDGQELPVVRVKGVTRSLDDSWDENANSETRGKPPDDLLYASTFRAFMDQMS